MMKISFVSALILLSVLLFVNRIYYHFKKQHIFPLKMLTKIGTIHFAFLFLIYLIFFFQPFWFWILSILSIIIIPVLIFILKKIQQQHFYSEFLRFLSLMILKMQMGLSFRSAFEQSLGGYSWRQQALLSQIYENVVFSPQVKLEKTGLFGRFIDAAVNELHLIHEHQHQAIDRLCNFRKNLESVQFFRRRSRQIWFYFAYQLGLLSFIYFGLLIYISREYGFSSFFNVYFASFSLYFLGITTVFLIARGKKWHI